MSKMYVLVLLLVLALLIFGCSPKTQATGYANYQQQQQQPYYGGGCGVAPADNTGVAGTVKVSATVL